MSRSLRLPDVAAGGFFARFLFGARFAASGIGFTFTQRRLFLWALVPMAVQALIFGALLLLGFRFLDDIVTALGPEPGHWYSVLGTLLAIVVGGVIILLSVLGSIFLGSVVCDPFYDVLSENTESILLGRTVGEPLSVASVVAGIVRELTATVLRLALYLAVAIPLWLIGLTGIGSVIAVPGSLCWTWLFVALESLSRSQARHAIAGKKRFSATFDNKAVALGFGAAGFVFAYVPLTTPFLVVGGTRLFLALAAWDRVPSGLSDDDKAALRAGTAAPAPAAPPAG
jgi:uncharacterized protein involved in cysteine biosynthesis